MSKEFHTVETYAALANMNAGTVQRWLAELGDSVPRLGTGQRARYIIDEATFTRLEQRRQESEAADRGGGRPKDRIIDAADAFGDLSAKLDRIEKVLNVIGLSVSELLDQQNLKP